jgi:Tn3 transposase DDE domain
VADALSAALSVDDVMTPADGIDLVALLDVAFDFERQPDPVPAALRPERRVPLVLLLVAKSHGAGASWKGLQLLSWVVRDPEHAELLMALREDRDIPDRPVVRFEPALDRALGEGHIATVDGMRFRVPVRSIHTGPNPRYFARGRGVTWLNYMTDQFRWAARDRHPRHAARLADDPRRPARDPITERGRAKRDHHRPGRLLRPGVRAVLAAGLPVQRPPGRAARPALLAHRPNADYGPLGGLARHRVNTDLITEQWEDILRVAGSLSTGVVRASELLRVLQGGGRPTRLGRAIAELGRIAKTFT